MELGYLTKAGHYVEVDSFGRRTICKALRIDESKKSTEFLGVSRSIEALGQVQVTVWLHRNGWANPGERILGRSRARLYRTRTGHYVLGGSWRRIKGMTADAYYWRPRPSVWAPFLWRGKFPDKATKLFPPGRKRPFVVRFLDQTVTGSRREGRIVELLGFELKDFSQFVIGKLSAELEFEDEASAESFAKSFPAADDRGKLDTAVSVDVGRDKRLAATRREKLTLASCISSIIGIPSLIALLTIALHLPSSDTLPLLEISTVLAVLAIPSVFRYRRRLRSEIRDLRMKWPTEYFRRWTSQFPLRSGALIATLKELNVTLDPTMIDMRPLQNFLQRLPPDTFFGALALDISGYLAHAFLQIVGRGARFNWRPEVGTAEPVLVLDEAYLSINFLNKVRNIWISKGKEELDHWLWNGARVAEDRLALQPIAILIALGFMKEVNQLPQLHDDLRNAIPISLSKQQRMGEHIYRVTWIRKSPFDIAWTEIEKPPPGWGLATIAAIPFCSDTKTLEGKLEASSPRSPSREDLAIVRFKSNDLVPLGVLLHNYLEVGPAYVKRSDQLELKIIAAVEEAQVVTPRMRDLQSQVRESIGPKNMGQGIPMDSQAAFMGRIVSISETANPFTGIPLWRIGIDFSGFNLDVLVRKDKCGGNPQPGLFLAGTLWLVGDLLPSEPSPPSEYIG